MKAKLKFYHYCQNNSGGTFVLDKETGITHHVIIQAASAAEADAKAENIGLYWNGVDMGRDCHCCGDRWYRLSNSWSDIDEGKKTPMVYSSPASSYKDMFIKAPYAVAVHYYDGRIEWPQKKKQNKAKQLKS